jgi:inhibitor of cysteine peptidase
MITVKRSWLKSVLNVFPLMVLLTLLGCSASTSAPAPESVTVDVSCDEFGEQPEQTRDVTVEAGSTLTVALCANPTTGFQWEEIAVDDPDVVEQADRGYQAPDSDALGASGREVWTFRAPEVGQTTLASTYGQPWEGGIKEEWTFTLAVTVE